MEASEFFEHLTQRSLDLVVDTAEAAAAGAALGFRVVQFAEYDFGSEQARPALTILSDFASIPRLHSLWGQAAARFCHLALAKFDGSAASLHHALGQLLSLDSQAALRRRSETYEQLLSCQDLEIQTAAGVLRCHMRDELEIPNPGTVLQPGWLYSIAEFFEASVVNLQEERSSFWVEGDFSCDGLIYLCNTPELKAGCAAQLDAWLSQVASFRATLRFDDNQLTRLTIGGTDVTADFLALVRGQEREAAVTELGLGCAAFPHPAERSRNIVLNKSGLGAYVGVGKGRHLPHIDFVAQDARLHFLAAAERA